MPDPDQLAALTTVLIEFAVALIEFGGALAGLAAAVLSVLTLPARRPDPAGPRRAVPLDPPRAGRHHEVMAAQQPRRWADLDPAERQRRQQQSQADQAAAAAATAAETERRRRQSQSDRDRARARAAAEHDDAIYRTVHGDIDFMDKHDW